MTNLIPQVAKHRVTMEYWTRVFSVWIFIFSGIIGIAAVLLIPVRVLITSQVDVYAESANEAGREVNEYGLSSSVLIKSSNRAGLILNLSEKRKFSTLVDTLNSLKNNGVTIESLEFSRDETKAINPITMSGKALDRKALADFRETLLSNDEIADVFLPISNLARDKDISFVVTITMASST